MFQSAQTIAKWKRGLVSGVKGKQMQISNTVRNYLIEKHGNKCSLCGWKKKHPISGKVPLQVHHIDGNAMNTVEKNLQVLCPNCHALTDNYGARNKMGRGKRNKVLFNR